MATPRKRIEPKVMLDPALPYIPYIRVSDLNGRDVDSEEYGTEKVQRSSIEKTAATHRLPLMPEPFPGAFIDRDVSGHTFERPGWQLALSLIRDGKAAGVITRKQSRMSRAGGAETVMMVREVEALGGRLYEEGRRVAADSGMEELVTYIQGWQDNTEREQRRADRMKSVENAVGRGVHLQAPYGYEKGPDKRLVIVEKEAEQVRRAFELRAGGHTWPAIADALNSSGARPRPYKRDKRVLQAHWQHKTVRLMVMNRVYLGIAYNGDHETPDAHDAIVEPDLFKRANQTRGTKPTGRPKGPSEGHLLTGLVRCSSCGYAMVHQRAKGHRYYRCLGRQHGEGRCPEPVTVPADALEDYVVCRFKAEYLSDEETFPVEDDSAVLIADQAVARAKGRLTAAMGLIVTLGDDVTTTERELVKEQVQQARSALRDAERDLRAAQMRSRGADLDPELDADEFDRARIEDVQAARLWLSRVYACVVVRRALRWREPAGDRAALVGLDEAPQDATALRAFTRGRTV